MHLIVRNYFQTNNQPIRHEMGYTIAEAASIRCVFYSSMYRASIFPRQLTEHDTDGNAYSVPAAHTQQQTCVRRDD